jgi:hypothetical protein
MLYGIIAGAIVTAISLLYIHFGKRCAGKIADLLGMVAVLGVPVGVVLMVVSVLTYILDITTIAIGCILVGIAIVLVSIVQMTHSGGGDSYIDGTIDMLALAVGVVVILFGIGLLGGV